MDSAIFKIQIRRDSRVRGRVLFFQPRPPSTEESGNVSSFLEEDLSTSFVSSTSFNKGKITVPRSERNIPLLFVRSHEFPPIVQDQGAGPDIRRGDPPLPRSSFDLCDQGSKRSRGCRTLIFFFTPSLRPSRPVGSSSPYSHHPQEPILLYENMRKTSRSKLLISVVMQYSFPRGHIYIHDRHTSTLAARLMSN